MSDALADKTVSFFVIFLESSFVFKMSKFVINKLTFTSNENDFIDLENEVLCENFGKDLA